MDSLTIQDAFEPYYADRKRFAPKRRPLSPDIKEKTQTPQQPLPPARPVTQADKTMEH
jgi:hypothetical protein